MFRSIRHKWERPSARPALPRHPAGPPAHFQTHVSGASLQQAKRWRSDRELLLSQAYVLKNFSSSSPIMCPASLGVASCFGTLLPADINQPIENAEECQYHHISEHCHTNHRDFTP